ncbi:MAG TPA: RNA polymerase factor sigma-54 [Halanaerobiales bacterium]|nr:RNA polymerase factor sigma-54 [Halanaerobiales bacterium]
MDLALDLSVDLEQKQELVMTPKLQMAIKLLQYSSMELKEYVEEEMKDNPLLEKHDENENHLDDRIKNQYQSYRYGSNYNQEDFNYENMVTYQPNLLEYLENQLYEVLDNDETEAGEYILGNLDERGLLSTSLDEIAEELDEDIDYVKSIIKKIQKLEPAGIAATNLKECYLTQLKQMDVKTNDAELLIGNHLDLIVTEEYKEILDKTGWSEDRLSKALHIINKLTSKPASLVADHKKTQYIMPDIVIKKVNDEYVIVLNDKASPLLRINPYYYEMMQKCKKDDTYEYLEDKFKSALWIIKSIEQRRMTVYRIAKTIADKQKNFLDDGVKYLKPLTMQEIADEIDMHESTVSRATDNKFIQTPRGIFDFKFFFSGGVNDISTVSIKAIIIEIIKEEDKSSPLSDNAIAELLRTKQNLKLSRRTIAKYRNELGIPSSVKRRKKYSI